MLHQFIYIIGQADSRRTIVQCFCIIIILECFGRVFLKIKKPKKYSSEIWFFITLVVKVPSYKLQNLEFNFLKLYGLLQVSVCQKHIITTFWFNYFVK